METALELGKRLRSLRGTMTIDALALRSGVSRAMISRIERGEASPTAQLLARLCQALGQSLSQFFADRREAGEVLSTATDRKAWTDPATGYRRFAVSPPHAGSPIDIVEVELPAGATVAFAPMPVDDGMTQHVWLFDGCLALTVGEMTHRLEAGDCLFMRLADGVTFHNPGSAQARYAVILNRQQPAR